MTSLSPTRGRFGAELPAIGRPAPAAGRRRVAMPPGTLSALVAIAGFAVCMIGGGWKAGAFNMLPRDDGLFTSGVFTGWALLGHGFPEKTALAIASPILAVTLFAFARGHHAPLAMFGAEVAMVGGFGLVVQRWRAYWSS